MIAEFKEMPEYLINREWSVCFVSEYLPAVEVRGGDDQMSDCRQVAETQDQDLRTDNRQ